MTDQGLRAALEKQLETLPTLGYENGYPVQALPKAELLSLLAAHPAEPAPRPLLDPQAVAEIVYTAIRATAGPAAASVVGTDILSELLKLARPMPTQAELADWLRETFTADSGGTSWEMAAECLLIAMNGAD